MPRNRRDLDRSEKVDEIVAAGARAVVAGGYESLSFQGIASDLGLARGAVQWYFPTKDDLFAASAAAAIRAALARRPRRAGHVGRILWAVEQLAELQPIHTGLQDRARQSPAAAAVLEGLQAGMRSQLRDLLHPHVEPSRLDGVADTIVIFVQGLLSGRQSKAERERRLRFVLTELLH